LNAPTSPIPKPLVAILPDTMQGQEIEIRHCSSCRPIDRDETKYHTDIIATSCIWRENLEVDYSLQQNPNIGQTYFVTLNQPVKFFLNMELWLFYDCPLAFYNGYEKEEEIELATFYYGQISKIISYNELGATIEFTVSKKTSFQDILKTRITEELPSFWTNFFIGFLDRQDYSFETFGKYYKLSVSAQGDLGQTCIFTEYENEFIICMFSEWNFSENGTYGGKYKLPEKIKKLIMS
jgi:hypothetical protein